MTYQYIPPLSGTFYVPPKYAQLVAETEPTHGDFARGARTYAPAVAVIGFPFAREPVER